MAWALSVQAALVAQEPEPLTLDRIFASGEFFPSGMGQARWRDGSTYTLLDRSQATPDAEDIVQVDARTGERKVLVPAVHLRPAGTDRPLDLADYHWSEDGRRLLIFTNTRRVWRTNTRGDYWVLDLPTGRLARLGGDAPEASLMFAKFSPDGSRAAYVRENDIYVEDLGTGAVTRITSDGSRTIINGNFDWVYEEEFTVQDGFRWSPDGTRIAYWQLDASGVRDFLLINDTDSLYSFTIPVQYPKAGTTNSSARVGVVSASGGPTVWMRVEDDPRNNYIARMEWAEDSREIVFQHLNRLQNRLQLMSGSAADGRVRVLLDERDSAWVDVVDEFQWLDGGRRFAWVSDRDGWRRVYVVNRDGSGLTPVTPAEVDAMTVLLVDGDGGWVYYIASPDDPVRRYLYRAPLDGSLRAERLTPADQPGWHSYRVSPDASHAFHTFSTAASPPVTSVVALPGHSVVRTLVDNADLRAKVTAIIRRPREFFRVTTASGVRLDGWVMKPNDFDPSKRYPVLFYVYGEPWGTTVTDSWGGTSTMWYQYLTDHGYLVMSLDNRGTPVPRGRAWRKSVYQKLGVITSQDQAEGVQAIIARFPYVDPARVAIWGWSGGGSSTLNALFRYPKIYHVGMAVAPVADLRYYDTIYQERYTGLPSQSPGAYRDGSPITFAHQLEGDLLVVHGTGDDNVHYQGTEALINELVKHGKPFTMMAYPNRTHGIFEGPGTTRHLYGLLTQFLMDHLPAGGR
jgi:dipeptidyl-peptidase-4